MHDNLGSTFRGLASKIWQGKNRPEFDSISDNFILWSRIIEYLRNGGKYQKSEKQVINCNPSQFQQKLGELWSTNKKVRSVHVDQPTNKFFGKSYLGFCGVLPPKIFTCARKYQGSLLTHTHRGRGPRDEVPPTFFTIKI